MGFDIHGVFQARVDDQWIDIPGEYNEERDYYLYGWLGMGHNGLTPITVSRGLPPDFEVDRNNFHTLASPQMLPPNRRADHIGEQKLTRSMGEWGFSWLLATEIMSAPRPVIQMRIWMPIDAYQEWDKVSNPKRWHRLNSNWQQEECSEHYATPENISRDTWWVIVNWEYDFTEDFKYFADEVQRLTALYGDVRYVFGFS